MDKITPQALIYKAWKNTGNPVIYHTKDGSGNNLSVNVNFVDPPKHEHYEPGAKGICNVCGCEVNGGIHWKRIFGSTYMDWGIHKHPEEPYVCEACAFCLLTNSSEPGRVRLSKYSFVAEETLHIVNRAEMREYLIHPPKPPFVMVCAESQKKHLATKARVSYTSHAYFCNMEERVVKIKKDEIEQCIVEIEAMRGLGITKADIEKGHIPQIMYVKYGYDVCARILDRIQKLRELDILSLANFVAQKMELEEAKCYWGLGRTIW